MESDKLDDLVSDMIQHKPVYFECTVFFESAGNFRFFIYNLSFYLQFEL